MNNQMPAIVALLCLAQLMGCTSMHPVESAGTSPVDQLDIGDHLVIYEKTGRVVDMTLSSIEGDTLRGTLTADPERAMQVNVADIEMVEKEHPDDGKTFLALAGGGLATVYTLGVIFLLLAIAL